MNGYSSSSISINGLSNDSYNSLQLVNNLSSSLYTDSSGFIQGVSFSGLSNKVLCVDSGTLNWRKPTITDLSFNLTASKCVISDSAGSLTTATMDSSKLNNLDTVISSLSTSQITLNVPINVNCSSNGLLITSSTTSNPNILNLTCTSGSFSGNFLYCFRGATVKAYIAADGSFWNASNFTTGACLISDGSGLSTNLLQLNSKIVTSGVLARINSFTSFTGYYLRCFDNGTTNKFSINYLGDIDTCNDINMTGVLKTGLIKQSASANNNITCNSDSSITVYDIYNNNFSTSYKYLLYSNSSKKIAQDLAYTDGSGNLVCYNLTCNVLSTATLGLVTLTAYNISLNNQNNNTDYLYAVNNNATYSGKYINIVGYGSTDIFNVSSTGSTFMLGSLTSSGCNITGSTSALLNITSNDTSTIASNVISYIKSNSSAYRGSVFKIIGPSSDYITVNYDGTSVFNNACTMASQLTVSSISCTNNIGCVSFSSSSGATLSGTLNTLNATTNTISGTTTNLSATTKNISGTSTNISSTNLNITSTTTTISGTLIYTSKMYLTCYLSDTLYYSAATLWQQIFFVKSTDTTSVLYKYDPKSWYLSDNTYGNAGCVFTLPSGRFKIDLDITFYNASGNASYLCLSMGNGGSENDTALLTAAARYTSAPMSYFTSDNGFLTSSYWNARLSTLYDTTVSGNGNCISFLVNVFAGGAVFKLYNATLLIEQYY